MTVPSASKAPQASSHRMMVMAPRAGDLLAMTLRSAYGNDTGMSMEFADCLAMIDAIDRRNRRREQDS